MRRTPTLVLISVMILALGAIGITAVVAWQFIAGSRMVAPPGRGGFTAAVKIGGPFKLVSHRGEKVSDETYRGRFLLVYFGYAYCPDVCPTELARFALAYGELRSAVPSCDGRLDGDESGNCRYSEALPCFLPEG